MTKNILNQLLNAPLYYVVMFSIALFTDRLVSSETATTLIIILLIDLSLFLFLKTPIDFNVVRRNSVQQAIIGFTGFIAIVGLSTLLISLFQNIFTVKPSLDLILDRIGTTIFGSVALKPLASNNFVAVFLGGFVIAIAETRGIIARGIELLSTLFEVSNETLNRLTDKRTIGIIFTVSTLFVVYHLAVKGVNDNVALLSTFIFAVISCIMILKSTKAAKKEIEGAAYLHVINNTAAMLAKIFGIAKNIT